MENTGIIEVGPDNVIEGSYNCVIGYGNRVIGSNCIIIGSNHIVNGDNIVIIDENREDLIKIPLRNLIVDTLKLSTVHF